MGLKLDVPEELGRANRRPSRGGSGGAGSTRSVGSVDADRGLGRLRRRKSVRRFVDWVETWARAR